MSRIENIIFDVGRVLVDFSLAPFIEFLQVHSVDTGNLDELAECFQIVDYEHGWISTSQFMSNVRTSLPVEVSEDECRQAWQNIFTPCDEMLQFARALRNRYAVYLLSNTNELHWDYLDRRLGISEIAVDYVASHQVGAMKPNVEIYLAALERFSIIPEQSVYIDDIEENVSAAEKLGLKGVHHQNPSQTKAVLSALGVNV